MLFGVKVCDGKCFVNAGRDEPQMDGMESLPPEDFGGFFGERAIGRDVDVSREVRESHCWYEISLLPNGPRCNLCPAAVRGAALPRHAGLLRAVPLAHACGKIGVASAALAIKCFSSSGEMG